MAKFRIIKIDKLDYLGRSEELFEIQKKWLFWWFSASITEQYFDYQGRAMIIKRNYQFCSLESATKVLDKLSNPFKIKYKGETIRRVFGDNTTTLYRKPLDDIYINTSNVESWNGGNTYEYSSSVEELKKLIDIRKSKAKITILSK